jgi:tRNA(adenine34) deaminase
LYTDTADTADYTDIDTPESVKSVYNNQMNNHDIEYMKIALVEAEQGEKEGEVPVGAVIVYENQIIAQAHNQNIQSNDSTAHAELLAIRLACQKLNQKRLDKAWIYITKEPCPMCAGAMVLAHIDRLIYGVNDIKSGAAGSVLNLVNRPELNHQIEVTQGILENECRHLLQSFFQKLRKKEDDGLFV